MAFLSDAALGSGISELLKVVTHFAKQTKNFRPNLKTLQKTLESVKPTFDNIGKLHKLLDRPQQDTDQFIKILQSGQELVKKCSTIPCWNVYKSCIYSKKLVDLDQSIVKFFNVQVQGLGFLASLRTEVGVEKCSDKLDLILENLKISDSGFSFWGSVPGVPDGVVGFDQPLKELKEMLLKDKEIVKVISAPGGCGKTTLAKMLCHDPDIQNIFGKNILFVTVSKSANITVIVEKIFKSRLPEGKLPDFQNDNDAINHLEYLLKQISPSPILLVLDDVWSDWESLIDTLAFSIPYYKILVTSRFSFPRFSPVYDLKILNDEDPMSKDLDKLFEKVKAKVEALKAAAATNARNNPFPDMSASTPDKASSLEKTIENGEQDSLPGLPIISQRAEVTADTDPPLVCNSVHKLEDIKYFSSCSYCSYYRELSSCKAILKEYADKINVENPNYETEKADGSNLAFVSSLTFNGKQYVGEEGRNKKESQHLAARVVIQSILDSDARDVISKIIKSKEKIICPAKPKVQNQCNSQNVCMRATIQTDNNVCTSSSKGNDIEVVVNDSILKTATQEPCAGNSSSVSAKPVLLVEELSSCKAILKEYADKINVENPNYKTEKADGSHLAFVSSLTFGGKQYVGDKGRNKKESQHLAARAVILSILDSDAHDVISKIIKSKEKMFCSAKGTVHNPCNVQNVGVLVGIQTGCNNFGSSLNKGSELKVVVKDDMLKTASQDPYAGNLSTVIANPVSLVEASSTPTLFVPPNSEQLVCGSTSSKKRKRKTKKAEHKVGVGAQVQGLLQCHKLTDSVRTITLCLCQFLTMLYYPEVDLSSV